MKTVKSFGIYFNVSLEKEKEGKAPIYMCIMVEGKKTWVALQQKMLLDRDLRWFATTGLLKFLSKKFTKLICRWAWMSSNLLM